MDTATSKKAEATTAPAKARKTKKASKAKAQKQPTVAKTKREKVENPVVFAFRLSEADRKKIHDAAGSAKASRFVLAAALAAADGDIEAFKRIVQTHASD